MIDHETLRQKICDSFCTEVTVTPIPYGLGITAFFLDKSGDLIDFDLVKDGDGFRLEDDGDYLDTLMAFGIPVDKGQRRRMLDSILADAGAYWDEETVQIRSQKLTEEEVPGKILGFLQALIRVRDIQLLTREVVKSTFKEDAIATLETRYGRVAEFNHNQPIDEALSDFSADLIIRPKKQGKTGAIYFITSDAKLSEALLLQMATTQLKREDCTIIGVLDDSRAISKKRLQRAENYDLSLTKMGGDKAGAIEGIGRSLNLGV